MKLSAQKIAKWLWIAAAVLAVDQWVAYFMVFDPAGIHLRPAPIENILISLANSIVYAGAIAGLGAAIHLLGEIRDRLPQRP